MVIALRLVYRESLSSDTVLDERWVTVFGWVNTFIKEKSLHNFLNELFHKMTAVRFLSSSGIIIGRFCSTHNTYENYVRCLRTTNVKIGFACAFGPTYVVTYVVTYVFSPFLPSTWPHAGTDARRLRLPARAAGRRWPWSALLSCERHLRWCQELRWSSNQSLSARKHWSINSYSPASPRLSVVTGDRDPEGDPEGEALASMQKRTGEERPWPTQADLD